MATVEPPRKDGDTYALQRNLMASTRLNAQHCVWREVVGFDIHPEIPVRNAATTRIADIGTGTGIWMLDVKRQYPEVQVDGFDLSLEQAPASEWMQPGTSLHELDITKPIPEHLRGNYDVVHVRLFVLVVKDDSPAPVVKNLMEMLKPGGWLQWGDHHFPPGTIASVDIQSERTGYELLLKRFQLKDFGKWMIDMAEIMTNQGMEQAKLYKYSTPPHLRSWLDQVTVGAMWEFSYSNEDNSSDDGSGPQLRKVVDRATQESRHGVALDLTLFEAVARKPEV